MIQICVNVYKIDLPNRPIDEVFAFVDRFSRYMASNYGLIFDTKNNKLVSQFKYRDENQNKIKYYYRVNVVGDDGKKHCARVNRLVLMAFAPLDDYNNLESNHRDLNTENNCLYNLEWVTHLENVHHYLKFTNNDIYSDEIVHKICEGIMQNRSYEDIIINVLKLQPTDKLKVYISAIRNKKIRTDISNSYNFPNKKRNNSTFTDDQMHFICQCICNGDTCEQILNKLDIDLSGDPNKRINVLNIIKRIKNKERFTRISDLYF